ncbi:MAG: stalk domain-containing protein [Candidatus Cryosericum sp.]|nr:copper amine oxidase N-terminal domain-containing protein [bacterium]
MAFRAHRETVLGTSLTVALVFMLLFQTIAPSAGVKAADTTSVWHLAGHKARNISYTDGATNGSLMVNVGTRGTVALSTDLVHWESVEQFTSKDLYGICWGAGRYVTVGDEGTLYVSTDGRTWDQRDISTDAGLAGVACGNGVYVAVGVDGTIIRSSDGATWTVSGSPVDKNLYHITWGNGRFVAVGENGTIVTSADGITWQDRTFAAREDLYGVAWGKDKFVAAGSGSLILTSPDGVTWTQREAVYEDLTFAAVAYAGDAFILAANHDAINQTWDVPTRWAVFYFRSTDGTSWQNMQWQKGYVWKRSNWVRGMLWTGSLLVSFGDNGSVQTSPDGMRWTNRTSARNAIIIGITSGAGKYVGVGTEDNFNGAVYSSTDSVTWQHEVNPQVPRSNENYEQWQDDLYGAAYCNGVFVAVGSYGVILRSEDSHTWTVERSGTQDSLLAVVRAGDQFAAVGEDGTLLTSPDGHVWTRRVPAQPNLLYWSAAVGPNTLLIMGADLSKKTSRTIVVSIPIAQLAGVDPVTISTPVAIGVSDGSSTWLAQIAYGNGHFVAVADALGQAWYSDDGLAWISSAPIFGDEPVRAITFAQNTFVAVGDSQTIAVSQDGSSWNVSTSGSTGRDKGGGDRLMHEDYLCVYGDDKLFVATTSMSGVSLSYDGGINWAGTVDNGTDATLTAVSDTTSGLVAVGELACVRTSNDGILWQQRVTDASGWLWDVTPTPFGVVAVGEFGLIMTSLDLATWTVMEPVTEETLTSVAAGNGHVVVIGDNHVVVTSEDGQTWTVGETGLDSNVNAIAFGAGMFVAVGHDGAMATSVDGRLWKQGTTGVTVDLDDVAWLNGMFVATGSSGTILTSANGVMWTTQKTGTTAALFAVTSGKGLLVAVGDQGTTIVSSDGAHWSVRPSPTKEILYGCAARGDRFVAVGSSETMMWTSDLIVPASPVPIRPLTGATVDAGSVTLVWSAVSGNGVTYEVQTSAAADFSKLILDKHGVTGTSIVLGAADVAPSGLTLWRVRTTSGSVTSSWSAAQSFAVQAATPQPLPQTKLVLHVASTQMFVDGAPVTIDVAPQIIAGRTLLPIKWVAEPLGATVEWNASDRKVTISLNATVLELWIAKSQARVNGRYIPIDTANPKVVPLIVSGRTMLPVRFVAEQLGADVQWEASTQTITITSPAA